METSTYEHVYPITNPKISYWHAVLTPATKNMSETQHFLHELRPASNLSPQKNTTEKVHVWWSLGRAQWITRTSTKCREFHIQARWALAKERRRRAPHTRFQTLVQKHPKKHILSRRAPITASTSLEENPFPKNKQMHFANASLNAMGIYGVCRVPWTGGDLAVMKNRGTGNGFWWSICKFGMGFDGRGVVVSW